jgi:hypothetical protein
MTFSMPAASDCGQYHTRGQITGEFVTANITAETAGIFKIGVNFWTPIDRADT